MLKTWLAAGALDSMVGISNAQAMPVGDASGDAHVILAYGGCPYGHRGPYGGCQPGSGASPGAALGRFMVRLQERGVRRATALGRIGMRVGRSLDT